MKKHTLSENLTRTGTPRGIQTGRKTYLVQRTQAYGRLLEEPKAGGQEAHEGADTGRVARQAQE